MSSVKLPEKKFFVGDVLVVFVGVEDCKISSKTAKEIKKRQN